MNLQDNNIRVVIFKDKLWFRLFVAATIFASGALGLEKQLVPITSLPLFLVFSMLFFVGSRGYILIDYHFITLKGFMSLGRLRKLPINRIRIIDIVRISGNTSFQIWFDPGIARSKFWEGTDNLLSVNPIFVNDCVDVIKQLLSMNQSIEADPSVYEFIDGKKELNEIAGAFLFGGLAVVLAFTSLILIWGNI
jgi:hypothetical protein